MYSASDRWQAVKRRLNLSESSSGSQGHVVPMKADFKTPKQKRVKVLTPYSRPSSSMKKYTERSRYKIFNTGNHYFWSACVCVRFYRLFCGLTVLMLQCVFFTRLASMCDTTHFEQGNSMPLSDLIN